MKELVVISGKGGTGKTCLTAAFSAMPGNRVLCDADVDAADLHLLTEPRLKESHDFQSGHTAAIKKDRCSGCGICRDLCRWNAINDDFEVNPLDCEGCGVCVYFCPENAVDFPVNTCGQWFISATRFGPMVHARLGIAEENSGKLVTLVRQKARKLAEKENFDFILTDGPPGVGCPVIAAIGGASAILIVTEPTISGHHDMERVVQLAAHFNVPVMICVNKYDLNPDLSRRIQLEAESNRLTWLGKIPFDPAFTKAMVRARTIFEYNGDSTAREAVEKIWKRVSQKLGLRQ